MSSEPVLRVQGRISQSQGRAVPGVKVGAFDRDLRSEEALGEAISGADGEYSIEYFRRQFRRAEKARADLIVRVLDANGSALASSDTVFNAGDVETIDLVIQRGAESEYERYVKELIPLIENVPLAELIDGDLHFLAGETGISYQRLSFLSLDAALAKRHAVDLGVFYALFRAGLSTDLRRLLAEKRPRWDAALNDALERNILPAGHRGRLPAILERLEQLALADAFAPPTGGDAPLGSILEHSGLNDGQRQAVARQLQRAADGEMDEAWERIEKEEKLDPAAVAAARFAVEAHDLVLRHLPVLKALQKERAEKRWDSVRDLARLGRPDWLALVRTSPELPPAFKNPETFADAVYQQIELKLPTAVVAHRLAADPQLANPALDRFFKAHPHFDLMDTEVDAYVDRHLPSEPRADAQALKANLKKMQRALRIAPARDRYEGMKALLANGLGSAQAIASRGKRKFLKAITPIMGRAWAHATFENAEKRARYADLVRLRASDYFGSIAASPRVARLPAELPTWARLFGTLSGCECGHCRSVLSPAAYLADLLKFLDDAPVPEDVAGVRPPMDVLRGRRPDLERILLDCDNANVPLPHIDIVNEMLEQAARGRPLTAHQTEGTPEALRAEPAHEDPAAYAALETAVFPWTLPFSLAHERARLFAQHLGLELHRLWRLAGRADDDVTRALLGFNTDEWRLVTEEPANDAALAARWGVAAVSELEHVSVFLERSGLTYAELEALTRCPFFSAAGIGPIRLDRGDRLCDLADDTLEGLTPGALDQIQRFIRVSRRLGWPLQENGHVPLDRALRALGRRAVDRDLLAGIGRLLELAGAFKIGVQDLISLDRPRLLPLLQLTEDELDLFITLTGSEGDATLSDVLSLLERWRVLRGSGQDVRSLAHVLLGWDQAPPAFTPSRDELAGLLRDLRRFMAGGPADIDPEPTIVENLATHLGLDTEIVDRLLRPAAPAPALLHAEADPSLPAIADLVAIVASAAEDGTPEHERARRLLLRLHRIARLVSGLGLSRRELETAAQVGADNAFLDLNDLPLFAASEPIPATTAAALWAGWSALARAKSVQRALPAGDRDLFDFLRAAADGRHDLAALAADTGWRPDDLAALTGLLGLDDLAFRRVSTYERLQEAMRWIRGLRVDGATLRLWAAADTTPDSLADSLQAVARSHQGGAGRDWFRVLTPLSDRLREARRDALLAHLIHSVRRPDGTPSFSGPGAVYAWFLVDPEMSSCALTSRIVQAAAAIQLFVQRCRLGLEHEVIVDESDGHWARWEWMRSYRVWEANRKVFLYPENWVQPELRRDKSPLFRDFESELLQDEVRAETVERAARLYLEQLGEVAHLDVRGIYHEEDREVLHVFARTWASPHVYYYRQRLRDRRWTAWERVDLDIQGDHVMPVVHQGRLFLFWPIFEEQRTAGANRESAEDDVPYLTARLAWSEHQNGKWQPRRLGTDRPFANELASAQDLGFRALVEDGELYLRVLRKSNGGAFDGMVSSILRLRFDACTGSLVNDPAPDTLFFLPPQRTEFSGMGFVEADTRTGAADPLYVTAGLGTDVFGLPERVEDLLTEGGLGGFILALILAAADAAGSWRTFEASRWSVRLLEATPGRFQLVPAHQGRQFTGPHPFFFKSDGRTYSVTPFVPTGAFFTWYIYRFEVFEHPYACAMVRAVKREGLEALSAGSKERPEEWPARQRARETGTGFRRFGPSSVFTRHEGGKVDFSFGGSYSVYNWELFFHLPLLAAQALSRAARFEDAQRWFRFIFDPTDTSTEPRPANVWRVNPFFETASSAPETLDELMRRLAAGDADVARQVDAWLDDPFDPHAIARLRLPAYMKAVVMKYLDHLVAWGDDLFRQDTRESINEAAQLYLLAAALLGERPQTIPAPEQAPLDYQGLRDHLDEFANALIDVEDMLPADLGAAPPRRSGAAVPPNLFLYFCIPRNDRLWSYWDTLADRLFKIRNCMDIEGRRRELALFEPPIDPALLVRARAAGLDLRQALRALEAPLPHHRYALLHPKAVEACQEVRALGGALLAALEKKDAEDLSLLSSRHETSLLSLARTVRKQQIDETAQTLQSLRAALKSAEQRREYYTSREFMNAAEITSVSLQLAAHVAESVGQGYSLAASIAHLFPQIHVQGVASGTSTGGKQVGDSLTATSEVFQFIAKQVSFAAGMTSTMGGYQRRQEEWDLQGALALSDIEQVQRQIAAAEIRLAVAEQELENHERQIELARETGDYLRGKFTNRELYGWMVSQLTALHQQAYQMAYELALLAEGAARRELGRDASGFAYVGYGHHDAGKKGLLAGERLHQALRRMDAAYLDAHRREDEITRHVSLAQIEPLQLVLLRESGRCTISLPEVLFDLDYPGHYRRRIKAISVTIPCVKGPYTNIGARLTLMESRVRWTPDGPLESVDLASLTSLATSSAQGDSGLFELSFRDERFLPFEGAGAVSRWALELPAGFRSFDYDSISDVILHVQYTASENLPLKERVSARLQADVNQWLDAMAGARTPMSRLVSLKEEFSSEFHRFLHPADGSALHELQVRLEPRHFPHFLRGRELRLAGGPGDRTPAQVQFLFKPRSPDGPPLAGLPVTVSKDGVAVDREVGELDPLPAIAIPDPRPDVPLARFTGPPAGLWRLAIEKARIPPDLALGGPGLPRLNPELIEDVLVLLRYEFA